LKEITVNNAPAFVSSNTFQALNVVLQPGSNTIVAIAEDLAGNTATNRIIVIGAAGASGFTNDPVQLIADPVGGFAPLKVSFNVKAAVPGELKEVLYDFDGNHVTDKSAPDFRRVTHTYAEPGERFPIVTVETTKGRFSSISWGGGFLTGGRINVQTPPVLVQTIQVEDPVDLASTREGDLYVLSGSGATLTEFDPTGRTIRSLNGIGAKPAGFDVDAAGNVYVAMRDNNQVWKFRPNTNSFEVDRSFGNGGFIGRKEGSAGSNSNQFSAPYDVAVSPDGREIFVSDSGNNRIQRFSSAGIFLDSIGPQGYRIGAVNAPKGLVCDQFAQLFFVDTGNSRVVVTQGLHGFLPRGVSGETGTALGQFRGAVNLCVGSRGICVADADNDRIQFFDPEGGSHAQITPFTPRFAISSELGLKQPTAVAWVNDLLEEVIYIADTGNNRVLVVKLPTESPEWVWNAMKQHVLVGDINGALVYFSSLSVEEYREAYSSIGLKDLMEMFLKIPAIKPVFIKNNKAQYRFEQMVQGHLITFPIEFVKEHGKWKIENY
jgi:DNA-binding beta-propeller fold protein YncE